MEISEEELKKQLDEAATKAKEGLFSQEQVNATISSRLKEEKVKFDKELKEKEEKAKMTAEELHKYELEKIQNELNDTKKTLQQKEHHENINKLMAEKKIDSEFFDVFSGISDIETAKTTMDKFNEKLSAKITTEIDGKIKPHVPSANTGEQENNDKALRNAMGL